MTDSNRTVLITGAAQGLGRAMGIGLLERGFSVAAVDRDANGLSALREQVGAGPKLEGFVADLTDFDAAKLAAEVEQRFGRIDILVNNAGIGQGQVRPDYHAHPPKFYEVTPGQWSRAIAVNANAIFLLSRAVVKPMIDRKWGRIINITTSLGTMLHGGSTPYGPSKASAEALSPFARDALLQPQVMLPPLLWLVSPAADHVTGKRFLGTSWDAELASDAAAEKAGAPIGWKALAVLPIRPAF